MPPNASATLVFRDELPTAERPDPEDRTPDDSPKDRAPQAPPAAVARHTTRSLTLHESPPPARKLSPQLLFLGQRIEQCLQFYANKPLNTLDDSAWSIMHSFLGYGIEGQVAANGPRGPRTNAVSWLCANKPFAGGYRLFYLENGELRAREGPGFQGHPAQFLAMLAQTRVSSKTPIQCEGRQFTVHDLVEVEKATCTSKTEMTFKLIGLSHYLNSDEEWTSRSRETWSIPKLLSIEMASPVNGVACGGTHRLMACSYALSIREQRGEPMDGPYTKAQKYIRDYQRYTMTLQNPDGSFSSDWFRRRTNWGDVNRKIQTTGHMLEWLVFSLPEADLYSVQLIKSVNFLTNLMIENRYQDWEVGPRGHALRALSLYHERVFEDQRAIADRTQANPR